MDIQRIVVIGASTGGFEALKTLVKDLPAEFEPPIFIVWHMPASGYGILPQVLNRANTVHAAHAYDHEPIQANRIYVAPPDQHLLIERDHIRVTRGPKENRFRPAIDPLFRSAAYAFGPDVIGIVLSGALDDGTAGLWTIKQHGGTAIVQDPGDAVMASMPASALREVAVDYSVPIAQLANVLIQLDQKPLTETGRLSDSETQLQDKQTAVEIGIAAEHNAFESGIMEFGQLTPYTCPECHGALSALKEGTRTRYRCHTGHAFSVQSLLSALTENIENSLYDALRGMEESVMLLNHMGDHFAETQQTPLAALYFQKAIEVEAQTQLVRKATHSHAQLSMDTLQPQSESSGRQADSDEMNHDADRF